MNSGSWRWRENSRETSSTGPHVDRIVLECGECGGRMKRTPDVLDVWIDSGVAGWAALHYPSETELFREWFPYDFITEGHDQTRGWFYSQLGCGVIALDEVPLQEGPHARVHP
jgi:Isoleucyl-tRNA synthetase (EC 6.1.1.5)